MHQPPGTPPNWLFGPVWTVLYAMMAVAAWRVWRRAVAESWAWRAMRLWGWQLLVNAAWTPVFFGLHAPGPALAVIVVLLGLILATVRVFARFDRLAAWLMAPYAAWVAYACYLNAGVVLLNR